MKSQASRFLYIASCIVKDIAATYPTESFDRDIDRLTHCSKARGTGFWTSDLPNLDALLLEGLESGRLSLKGPVSHRFSQTTNVPRLFAGLWLRVFNSDGILLDDPDPNSILFLRQLSVVGKRLKELCPDKLIQLKGVEYAEMDCSLPLPDLEWSEETLDPDRVGPALSLNDFCGSPLPGCPDSLTAYWRGGNLLARAQRLADELALSLGSFDPFAYADASSVGSRDGRTGFRHGPGAVAVGSKYRNKYEFLTWSAKLENTFPYREFGTIASDRDSQPMRMEEASRMVAVPKTATKPRLIAAEPVEHQWCQQVIRAFLVDRLDGLTKGHLVNFRRQDLSAAMVLRASSDRSLATVDLSDASDRLSCKVVERVFRKNPALLQALHASRTRFITLFDGSQLELAKFASQGTAVTFPVQTIVFLVLALASAGCESWDDWYEYRNRVRVFGDDIIVPTHGYDNLCFLLETLGLKVNSSKSFYRGHFRESCGMDAWRGHDVTPTKLSFIDVDGPEKRQSIIDASNNFFQRGFWHAAEGVKSLLPEFVVRQLPVVPPVSRVSGLVSFCGGSADHLQKRWDADLQRYVYRRWGMTTSSPQVVPGERFAMMQWLHSPKGDHYTSGYAERPRTKDGARWEHCEF